MDAFKIMAEYDQDLGYPVEVFIDFDQRIADEEQGWMSSNLTIR